MFPTQTTKTLRNTRRVYLGLFGTPPQLGAIPAHDRALRDIAVIEGTVVSCGQCGEPYLLCDEVADERLFRACSDCVDRIDAGSEMFSRPERGRASSE